MTLARPLELGIVIKPSNVRTHAAARQGMVQSELLILVLSNESDWAHLWLTIVDPMDQQGFDWRGSRVWREAPAKQLTSTTDELQNDE